MMDIIIMRKLGQREKQKHTPTCTHFKTVNINRDYYLRFITLLVTL